MNFERNLKHEAYKFINISGNTKTKSVAEHLNITMEEAYYILEDLRICDKMISSGGRIKKENMDMIVWIRKK